MSHHRSGLAWWRLLLVVSMLGPIAACAQPDDDNGQVVATRLFGCPDLAGTYVVSNARQIGASEQDREPWQQLSVEGKRGGILTFTWRRPWSGPADYLLHHSPATRQSGRAGELTDEGFLSLDYLPWNSMRVMDVELRRRAARSESWTQQTVRVLRKHEYGCSRGRLQVKTGSRAMLARSVDGGLLYAFVRRKVGDTQVSVWCGDGCRGPFLSSHQQTLWMKAPEWRYAALMAVDPTDTPFEEIELK